MNSIIESNRKPHAVLTPYPLQGHINAVFKLAKLLHLRGFHITFVHTEYNYKRFLKSMAMSPNNNNHLIHSIPHFRFETIPDGLPHPDDNGNDHNQDLLALCDSVRNKFLAPFRNLLAKLIDLASAGAVPPVSCLVSDGTMPFTIQAAQDLGLPILLLFPSAASSFLSAMHFRTLIHKGLIPLKDESCLTNGYLETKVDWIPGMKNFRLKDLPDFIRTTDPNDPMLQFLMELTDKAHNANAVVLNTFDELEGEVVNALSSMLPAVYTIGPFPSFSYHNPEDQQLEILGSNLWKEDTVCLEWLDSKEPRSVIYVNFGSITVISPEKLSEFAWGLANSKKPFLWIIRPDLVIGGSVVLSPEFVDETQGRGLIASWCNQEQVLNHPSVGGFLTHCGWNSTTESVCAGVPMLCWPFFADQPTNCRNICNEWGIGIEINNDVKRKDLENLVNELMVEEKGKKMRQKVMELKKKAEEVTRPGGSSYMNLDKVIKEVLLKEN
ncbi:hypothetical protein S83_031206 [Arachis hypogaea]